MTGENDILDATDEYIETASGAQFHFAAPDPGSIHIQDIAHALSMIVRYTGHCNEFYSVAEHSVLCAEYLDQQDYSERVQLAGLLHDAAEAYMSDISKPLKRFLPGYETLEKRLQGAIYRKFLGGELDADTCQAVKYADAVLLATEAKLLMPSHGERWTLSAQADCERIRISCWDWREARRRFMNRFNALKLVSV